MLVQKCEDASSCSHPAIVCLPNMSRDIAEILVDLRGLFRLQQPISSWSLKK